MRVELLMGGSSSQSLVSIVIPTKNAGPGFRETLAAIRRQSLEAPLFVIDSGSTDDTLDVARLFGANISTIRPESFNHGETRNLGISQTHSRFCVMLVQDAIPIGTTWMEELLSPFDDERVVGVTAQQVPRPDSDPIARWQVEYRIRFLGETRRIQELQDWDRFLTLDYQERLRLASFDNVCSAIRRGFWEQHPFRPVRFAEDLDWGMRAIRSGRRLIYNPAAQVIHSHNRPPAYHLKRSYVSGRIVPPILHMEPVDIGVYTDTEYLDAMAEICGEAQAIICGHVAEWRSFTTARNLAKGIQTFARRLLGLPRSTHNGNRLQGTFYFLMDQLLGSPSAGAAPIPEYLVPAVLAEAAGAFTADYHNWCEAHGTVSEGLRKLEEALSKGV